LSERRRRPDPGSTRCSTGPIQLDYRRASCFRRRGFCQDPRGASTCKPLPLLPLSASGCRPALLVELAGRAGRRGGAAAIGGGTRRRQARGGLPPTPFCCQSGGRIPLRVPGRHRRDTPDRRTIGYVTGACRGGRRGPRRLAGGWGPGGFTGGPGCPLGGSSDSVTRDPTGGVNPRSAWWLSAGFQPGAGSRLDRIRSTDRGRSNVVWSPYDPNCHGRRRPGWTRGGSSTARLAAGAVSAGGSPRVGWRRGSPNRIEGAPRWAQAGSDGSSRAASSRRS
jgi:hypothetical protein